MCAAAQCGSSPNCLRLQLYAKGQPMLRLDLLTHVWHFENIHLPCEYMIARLSAIKGVAFFVCFQMHAGCCLRLMPLKPRQGQLVEIVRCSTQAGPFCRWLLLCATSWRQQPPWPCLCVLSWPGGAAGVHCRTCNCDLAAVARLAAARMQPMGS